MISIQILNHCTSLDEMLVNPDKKKKLWHDIQSLLSDEMKENN